MWQTIKDWFWWTFVIRCNEFHPKLDVDCKAVCRGKKSREEENQRVYRDRVRAHRLDEKWG